MSKIKKVLAMLLALAMVLGTTLTTFAAEVTETTKAMVTVNGADSATIKYVQIVEPDRSAKEGWKISDAFTTYFDGTMTVADLIEAAKQEASINENAEAGTNIKHSVLAGILQSIVEDGLVTNGADDNESFEATLGGLYLIQAEKSEWTYSPMLAYVPVNSKDAVTVTAKGAKNQIKKEVTEGGESVAAGDIVNYNAEVRYPFFGSNYKDPTFIVTDTLTNAVFEKNSIVVTYGTNNTPLEDGVDYNLTVEDKTFTIDFIYDMTKAGGTVKITYSVKVDEGVSTANALQNKIQSEISPDADATPTRTEYIVISNPVKAEFTKVDANDSTIKLAGAKFQLYKGTPENGAPVGEPVEADNNGIVTFEGLDAQEQYYVVETVAPDGYSVDSTPHILTRSTEGDKPITETTTNNGVKTITTTHKYVSDFSTDKLVVTNTKLSSLPSTGGIGTTIFTIGGCLIMIVAAGLFFASRRKSAK